MVTIQRIQLRKGKIDLIQNYPTPQSVRHLLRDGDFLHEVRAEFFSCTDSTPSNYTENVKWESGNTEKYAFENV